jgi:hypothetical protein
LGSDERKAKLRPEGDQRGCPAKVLALLITRRPEPSTLRITIDGAVYPSL